MKTLEKLTFIVLQFIALLGFGFFSIIIVPAVMFLCGEDAVGYSKSDPHEFGNAVLIVVLWTAYLLLNIALPYIKKCIVREAPVIKPGTWHSESFK